MRGYRAAIEAQVPPAQRAAVTIQVVVSRPEGPVQRALSFDEIREAAEIIERGIPDCETCPLSGGRPVGCYRYVSYPVDAVTEQTVFALFEAEVGQRGSVCERAYEARLARMPRKGTGWHERRGLDANAGSLAELPAPLVHTWGGLFAKKYVDTAQILAVLVAPPQEPAFLALHAELHARIASFASERNVSSRGLSELSQLAEFYEVIATRSREGYRILVDA